MKRTIRNALGLALGLSCSGCTTLDVKQLSSADTPPQNGIPYVLPFTQFELTVSRTLNKCPASNEDVSYTTNVTVVSTSSEPDAAQEYLIDLTSLSNWWKTSDLKVSFYPGGILQSFNATAADQTGQIAQNVVTGLVEIAGTVATGGAAALKQRLPALVPPPSCKTETAKAVAIRDAMVVDTALKTATDKLNSDSAALKALVTAAPALGTQLNDMSQALIASAIVQVNNDVAALSAALDPVTAYQSVLTVSTTFRWPLSGTLDAQMPTTPGGMAPSPTFQQVTLPGGDDALESWFDNPPKATQFVAAIRLQRLQGAEIVAPSSAVAGSSGIRFRVPARGQLVLCDATNSARGSGRRESVTPARGAGMLPSCESGGVGYNGTTLPASTAAIWEGTVPQLGRINYLPYSNKPFQSNVLSATFNADGTLASAEYQEPMSAGVGATATFSNVAAAAAKTANTISTADTVKLGAELAKVQAQNNLTSAQATAATANQAAQLAQIQAQNNLISAQATQATAAQLAQATANTALLNALAAQANAEVALKTAQMAAAAAGATGQQ